MKIFKIAFLVITIIYVITLAAVTCYRGGKDLKVALFGVVQVIQKHSPYDNPTDPSRPIFRYAPAITILQRPFLLKSEMYAPFEFNHITPSVLMWYIAEILALIISAFTIYRLIPKPPDPAGLRNLLISFLLAMPLIAYELANSQNKVIALTLILVSIYLFEKNKYFLSAFLFNLGVVIYVPLIFLSIYFVIKGRIRFILSFATAFLIVFIAFPSLVLGYSFNNFLLKDWFVRCLKPFSMTTSYATYLDLRISSQSLPSAIGRMFVTGNAAYYKYAISPTLIHVIIRIFSMAIIALSVIAVWKNRKPALAGLKYSMLLMLPLVLPSYCLWYTWSWLFVIYFAVLNYIENPGVTIFMKKIMLIAAVILLIGSYSSAITLLNRISFLFWTTLIFWATAVGVLIKEA